MYEINAWDWNFDVIDFIYSTTKQEDNMGYTANGRCLDIKRLLVPGKRTGFRIICAMAVLFLFYSVIYLNEILQGTLKCMRINLYFIQGKPP